MVRERIYGSDTEFCAWMRSCKELPSYGEDFGFVALDNDLTVHRYKTCIDAVGTRAVQGIMQVEIKTRLGKPPTSQIDTISKLNLFNGDKKVNGVSIRFFGVFVLILSGTNPDDSDTMFWGKFPEGQFISDASKMKWDLINKTMLVELLRFERHPKNTKDTNPFRRHHKTQKFIKQVDTELGFVVDEIETKRS